MFDQIRKKDFPWEPLIWVAGLVAVAIPDPTTASTWSLCIFDALGITFCPGCGLGHAVGFLVRGELTQSLASHPLAIPVVIILIGRALFALVRYYKPAFR